MQRIRKLPARWKQVPRKPRLDLLSSEPPSGLSVTFTAVGTASGQPATIRYEMPTPLVRQQRGLGECLFIGPGRLDAEPTGKGVGSLFLRRMHRVFSQVAARTGKPLVHGELPTGSIAKSERFFTKHHGYSPVAMGLEELGSFEAVPTIQKVFRPGRVRRLSPDEEKYVEVLISSLRH